MSCTSRAGSRAAIAVAQHTSGGRSLTPLRAVRKTFHALLGEGRALRLEAPDRDEVERWFDETSFLAAVVIPKGRSRSAALKNLSVAWQDYRSDPLSVPGADFHAWQHTHAVTEFTRTRQPDTGFTVAMDVDGVLFDYNTTMREWFAARGFDTRRMGVPHTYSLKEAWGIDDEVLYEEMTKAVQARALWYRGNALDDGVAAAVSLGKAGHRVIANTARSLPGATAHGRVQARAATMTWLRKAGVHPDDVHVADPRDPATKLEADFDVLFDDHPENVRTALAAGRGAMLVDRPWNRDAPELPRLTFDEVHDVVDEMRMAKMAAA